MAETGPAVYLAFRFHVNFYHSYRGDSLDERGIGKDIRIIRGILADLDRLNAKGIPVRGTWDIENFYSLETLMRRFAPDLVEGMARRVREDRDEVEPMSWNNGIVSACTAEEFEELARLAVSNAGGSGLSDVFGRWAPILRPQECMYTPSFLTRYPAAGIPAISLYYSAVPFNGFSNFVRPLSFPERYNPLTLESASLPGSMTLLPCYNHGDVADRFASLRLWLKSLRRRQLRMEEPRDLLLILDADADDEFWAGMKIPVVSRLLPSFDGLARLVRSVADLPFLRFARPGDYLRDHPPVGRIVLDQDTADGSFDGLSSWAEKWENTELWTVIQRSRRLYDDARAAGVPAEDPRLAESLRERLLALSTTHFGMASPVMNAGRLEDGFARARRAEKLASEVLTERRGAPAGFGEAAAAAPPPDRDAGAAAAYPEPRLPPPVPAPRIPGEASGAPASSPVRTGRGEEGPRFRVLDPRITWGGRVRSGTLDSMEEEARPDGTLVRTFRGALTLPGRVRGGRWTRTETRLSGDDALFLSLEIEYPETPHVGYDRAKAARLDRTWDHRWTEVLPAEILPAFDADPARPFRVIKRNFFGDVSSYAVDHHLVSGARRTASFNNHITHPWVAVSNGSEGVLVAQYEGAACNFAFCPLRSEVSGGRQRLRLNPFGTYYGPQWRYATAVTGLGCAMAILMADQLDSYAPSYNGKASRFSVAVFPFRGPEPSEEVRRRAQEWAGV